ncbi:MAG: DNA polymerase III subunit delta [Oscillospiraceae bacterium]|nr:DNA polymerase III subunit delta [Oscillospiraceae bacterium]
MKKGESNQGYKTLKQEINTEELRTHYLLWGEEDYLREFYLGKMRDQILPVGLEELNYFRFDGKGTDMDALEVAIDTLPAFSPRKFIEIRDFDFYKAAADKRDRLDAILADVPAYCCIAFIFSDPAFKPDGRMKIHRHFKDAGLSVEFLKQAESDLIAWIGRRFAAMGKTIDRTTAEYLIFFCGGLMTGLIGEIEKIGAYAKGQAVTRADIDAVATPILDAVVWKFTDALGQRDWDSATKIMGELFLMREAPIMILAATGKQLRQLFSARLAVDGGRDTYYLKSLWGMRHDYPARLLYNNARKFSFPWLRRAVLLTAETDLKMKSTGQSGEALLKDLLIRLAAS